MRKTILDEIKTHNARIMEGRSRCNLTACPKCGDIPESFKLHEVRARRFRVVEGRAMLKVDSFMCRWKCPLCGRTSIDYPSFALPYKRYAKDTVLSFSAHYAQEDRSTYRDTGHIDGLGRRHDSTRAENTDERQIAPSTIHRWISFLSSLPGTLREACRLIGEKSPASGIFRRMAPLLARKYRSDERRKQLDICLRLLLSEIEYRRLFKVSIFPRLATAGEWG